MIDVKFVIVFPINPIMELFNHDFVTKNYST